MFRKLFKITMILFVLLCLVYTIHIMQNKLDKDQRILFLNDNPEFLPNGNTLEAMSMGYRSLVGDWLWIRSVLYYGRRSLDHDNPYFVYAEENNPQEIAQLSHPQSLHPPINYKSEESKLQSDSELQQELSHLLFNFKNKGLVEYIYPLLDRSTQMDPYFVFPYIFGSVYVLMDTGEIQESVKLLVRGKQANPERWEFPFYLGWIYWIYLDKPQMTYQYLLQAIDKDGCPAFVFDLVKGMSKKLNKLDFTRTYLEGLLKTTNNPEMRKQIRLILNTMQRKIAN